MARGVAASASRPCVSRASCQRFASPRRSRRAARAWLPASFSPRTSSSGPSAQSWRTGESPLPQTRLPPVACSRPPPPAAIAACPHSRRRDARDLEVVRSLVRHHMSFMDELLLAEIGHEINIAIILNTLGRGAVPFAVAEEGGTRRRVLVWCGGRAVCFIRERYRIAQGRRRARLGEHDPRQRRRRLFTRLQPKAVGPADVLAEVGPGGGQEHRGPVLGRGHRRRNGSRRAAYDQNVNIVQDRDLPSGFRDNVAGLDPHCLRGFRASAESLEHPVCVASVQATKRSQV